MHIYDLAHRYTAMGLSVLPVAPPAKGGKAPNLEALKASGYVKTIGGRVKASWTKAQQMLAREDTLQAWFSNNGVNIGIIGGPVSKDVVFLDFDSRDFYLSWARQYKNIVLATAVQKTSKGYHVAIRTSDNACSDMYYDGQKVGEVKGMNGYVVVEPSIHETGCQYQWLKNHAIWDKIVTVKSLEDIGLSRYKHEPPRQQLQQPRSNDADRARKALQRLDPWRADQYHEWLAVGMALSELGEAGRQLWHEWSAQSQKYDPRALDEHFDSFRRTGGRVIRLGTLFKWAQDDSRTLTTNPWRTL